MAIGLGTKPALAGVTIEFNIASDVPGAPPCVLESPDGALVWEGGNNARLRVDGTATVSEHCTPRPAGNYETGTGPTVSSVPAGQQFNVNWWLDQPSPDVHCYYALEAAPAALMGVAGWPAGTKACDGTACPGPNNPRTTGPVTLTATGSYRFGIACSDFDATSDQPLVTVTPPPPSFTSQPTATPSSIGLGSSVTIRWSTANASSCVGLAQLNGNQVSPAWWAHGQPVNAPTGVSVIPDQVGNYQLALQCAGSGGATTTSDWASFTVTAAPPTPPQFNPQPSASPSTITLGDDVTITWGVTNATSCTGLAKRNGQSITAPSWWASPAPGAGAAPGLIATPDAAGTYALRLSCEGAGGTTQSNEFSFTVNPVVGTCLNAANRITLGNVKYLPTNSVASNVNLTEWDQVFGRNTASGTIAAWPGHPTSAPQISWVGQDKFIALRFTVPSPNPYARGQVSHHKNWPGPNLDVTISTKCGDFSPPGTPGSAVLSANCFLPDRQGGQVLFIWNRPGGTPSNACILPAGEYYLNLKMTDPNSAASHPDCTHVGGGVYNCKETLENGFSTN